MADTSSSLMTILLTLALFRVMLAAPSLTKLVVTNTGSIIGSLMPVNVQGKTEHVGVFQGIPYAEAPVGQLRFRKPVAKARFTSPFDATKEGPACVQVRDPFLHTNMTYSEECLCLNIYTPPEAFSKGGLPVMIWIHGGGFILGSSNVYVGDTLSTFGKVIVVTLNYRLAVWGFFSSGDSRIPGNYGLWDQRLAIEWVHNHIASFGGDPNQVTLFGQSSGGLSCLIHATRAQNQGLFQRVIIESGGAFDDASIQKMPRHTEFAQKVGCPNDASLLNCLQSKSAADLEAVLLNPSFNLLSAKFAPVVDGEFINYVPEDILNGKANISDSSRHFFASLDIMIGVNSLDGAVFLETALLPLLHIQDINAFSVSRSVYVQTIIPVFIRFLIPNLPQESINALTNAVAFKYTDWSKDPTSRDAIREQILDLSSDTFYFAPSSSAVRSHKMLVAMQGINNSTTFQYKFIVDPTVKSLLPKLSWEVGANHGDEVLFVFGFSQRMMDMGGVPCCPSSKERMLSKAMMTAWTNFAKSGNPNMPMDVTSLLNTTWPQYDLTSQKYIQLSTAMSSASVKERFAAESVAFWTELVPSILKNTCTGHSPMATNEPDPMLIG